MKRRLNKYTAKAATNFLLLLCFFFGGVEVVLPFEENNLIYSKVDYLEQLPKDDYILGEGDVIEIVVSRDIPELTSIYVIDATGTITLPKLRRVYVSGLTIGELIILLNKKYDLYVINPIVEVTVKNYRPIKVYISGEVDFPGYYQFDGISSRQGDTNSAFVSRNSLFNYEPNISTFPTVFDAVRKAGGVNLNADLENIELTRINSISNGGGKKKTNLNFLDAIKKGDTSQYIRIYDGDYIVVGKSDNPLPEQLGMAIKTNLNPKFINVFVSGRINGNPGTVKLSKSSVLTEAIDMAGGARVLKGPVRFLRFNNDGTIDKRKFVLNRGAKRGSYNNPYLFDGDFIYVGRSTFNVATEVMQEITQPFSQWLTSYAILQLLFD